MAWPIPLLWTFRWAKAQLREPRQRKGQDGHSLLATIWTCLPMARPADTFVVDTEVSLGEADIVVLVLGAPGSRQWRFVLIDSRVQALQAPAQFLLPG